jgi:hypothetical protein
VISVLTVREVRKGIIRLRAAKANVADAFEIRVTKIFTAFSERIAMAWWRCRSLSGLRSR